MKFVLKAPIYDKAKDGNVFDWLLSAADDYRRIRRRERHVELEKLQFVQREKESNDNQRYKYIQSGSQ